MVNDGDTAAITVPAARRQDAVLAQHRRSRRWPPARRRRCRAARSATSGMRIVDNGFRPLGLIALSHDDAQRRRQAARLRLDVRARHRHAHAHAVSAPERRARLRRRHGAVVVGARLESRSRGHRRRRAHAAGDGQSVRRHGRSARHAAGGSGRRDCIDGRPRPHVDDHGAGQWHERSSPARRSRSPAPRSIPAAASCPASRYRLDGGATWRRRPARRAGRSTGSSSGSGTVTIRSRAYDDSGNMETPSAGVAINVTATRTCPCSVWASTVVPPAPIDDGDPSSVELGTKFRADTNGFITGVRFYKGSLNTGNHVGNLWTTTGTLLASVTFSGETASGWQQANFSSAVPITANTTYIVSYHAPNGHYTGSDSVLRGGRRQPAAARAARRRRRGATAVYVYTAATAFPNQHVQFGELLGRRRVQHHAARRHDAADDYLDGSRRRRGERRSRWLDHRRHSANRWIRRRFRRATPARRASAAPGTFELQDNSGVLISATVSYDSTDADRYPDSDIDASARRAPTPQRSREAAPIRGSRTSPATRWPQR